MAERVARGRPQYPNARPDSFEVGLEYQDWVCRLLAREHIILQNLVSRSYQYDVGENLQGFEIKYDERCTDTGRLSIEVAEKVRNDPALSWVPSGIMRNDNSWLYIQGNYDRVYIFAKSTLTRWYAQAEPEVSEYAGILRRFFLPFSLADVLAAKVVM